ASGSMLPFQDEAEASKILHRERLHALAMLFHPGGADTDAAIDELLRTAGMLAPGKVVLRDGRSGEEFAQPITVGEVYLMKLSPLATERMRARSTGEYSVFSHQPLLREQADDGQHVNSEQLWALQAHGAAHNLRELLTIKSDDIDGRAVAYE